MFQSIAHVIKRASFELFRACLVGGTWKKRQLTTNIYTIKSDFLFAKRRVFLKNCAKKRKKSVV